MAPRKGCTIDVSPSEQNHIMPRDYFRMASTLKTVLVMCR